MFSLILQCAPAEEDLLISELFESGTAGITEEEGALRAFFEDNLDADAVAARFKRHKPRVHRESGTDWEQVSREAWPPLCIGERICLVPPWHADQVPDGRIRLEVNPGMACGTGWHPCTQLCLEALERCVGPGDFVLDVGSGSGILSAAAGLLGARRVVGCDLDRTAVEIARERIPHAAFVGSIDAVRDCAMNVIVANISSAVIEQLRREFARVRKPESTLILSGFLHWEPPEGFEVKIRMQKGDWLCLVC